MASTPWEEHKLQKEQEMDDAEKRGDYASANRALGYIRCMQHIERNLGDFYLRFD